MLTQRMPETVSIVGAGRVGCALGRRLRELGWRIGCVTARSTASARAAVRTIGAGHAHGELTCHILHASVVLITTPDSAIEDVARKLAQLGGKDWSGKVVLHTSGALDSSVLRPLANLGASVGSIHPMQTFSRQNYPDLANCMFGIEGSRAALRTVRKMIHQMGGVAVVLTGANKAAYHAAGSFACVYVMALMETATRLLMSQGFKRRQAMRALLPLTRQTLDNFERLGPLAAWTGPLSRGDFSTIEKHAQALAGFEPEVLLAYTILSRLAAKELAGKPAAVLKQLEQAFAVAAGGPRH